MHRIAMTAIALACGVGPVLAQDDQAATTADTPCCATPWNSTISLRPPVDDAWVGSWSLQAAYAAGPGRLMQAPVTGVTLTVEDDGSFTMDYAGAAFADISEPPTEAITLNGEDVPPPAWAIPPGAGTPDCGDNAPAFSGAVTGTLRARFGLAPGGDGRPLLATAPYLAATADPEASEVPKLTCDGHDLPLGPLAGPPLGTAAQSYSYALYDGGGLMLISAQGGGISYVFARGE